jgi:hypothetical protein
MGLIEWVRIGWHRSRRMKSPHQEKLPVRRMSLFARPPRAD